MRRLLQLLVDPEGSAFIGAPPQRRSEARTTQRNGSREKTVTIRCPGM
jgi:putative transposase